MSTNSESTANSIKFAPMPMSTLLANLNSFQKDEDTPNTSFSTDESDDSFNEIVSTTPSQITRNKSPTLRFKITKDANHSAKNEKKTMYTNNHNKENLENNGSSKLYSAQKFIKTPSTYTSSEIKKRNHLMPQDNNVRRQPNKISSASKKTPDKLKRPNSVNKKTCTPIIKSGIRKFTPGSSHKQSHSNKKSLQQTVVQNRDKVRCELFRHPQKEEQPSIIEPTKPAAAQVPVPETPMNRQPMPTSYAATPSYPQGVVNNNSKILFKTTSIKDKKYMFIKKLGTGGSSEVYKVLEVGTSCEYAVKCVNLATDHDLAKGYINEVRLLRELQNSDRVIRLYDYEYDRQNQFLRLVLEVGETDLSSFLRARGAGLPPALVLHYWEEMLHAVNYIHSHGVIHADLKPANFLLVCGRLKLIDFGIASAISGDATSVVRAQAAGTYSYISPEALMGGAGGYGNSADIKISFRSDVWSLGCILYSMVYKQTPFGHIPNLAKLAAILDPNHTIRYPPVDHVPSSLVTTLKWCLTYNARSRPSVQELLNVKHLQPARASLPQNLLEKLRLHVTPDEFKLLRQAQI